MASVKRLGRPWIHASVMCDDCRVTPIVGYRMKCEICPDHDVCLRCFSKRKASGCKFLEILVDSAKFYPPFQIRYYSCDECFSTPIQGPRYCHKWRPNYDLCSDCFRKASEPADSYQKIEETEIHTLCPAYLPVFHFHKQCTQCGQNPISGPRFDSMKHDEDQSLCLICFDKLFNKGTVTSAQYQRIDRPEADKVVHITMFCCLQCGEIPICGPAFVNTRIASDSLCLQCYQHMDPVRWQYEYKRVEPPTQYGKPLSKTQPPLQGADISQLLEALELPNTVSNFNSLPDINSTLNFSTSSSRNDGGDTGDADIDKLNNRLNSAVVEEKPNVKWDDVAGLESAKQALQEAVVFPIKYPQFFEGDRKPWNAFLLYGPPGTGKSHLAKAVATEVSSTFFSISASDILSKWLSESEKLVSELFKKARKRAPSIIFIDEIDSIAGTRKEDDTSGVKTELLVQMQGVGNKNDKVLVLAATNLPYNLDQALRRRFDKRIYIPLPEQSARKEMFKIHLKKCPHSLTDSDFENLAARTPGLSGSDISVCVKDALWAPLRKIQTAEFFRMDRNHWYPCEPHEPGAVKITLKELDAKNVASKIKPLPISRADFDKILVKHKPTVSQADLALHRKFTKEFGEEGSTEVDADEVDQGNEWTNSLAGTLEPAVVKEKLNVKWSDVAGLESVKQALHEAVVLPIKHPQFFTGNRKPWTSFLLYGPPGTGKSYLAKAVATEVDSTFFSISSSDLAGKWHGESEKLVALLFQKVMKVESTVDICLFPNNTLWKLYQELHKKARKCAPSIIFIDEIDSICGQRTSDGTSGSDVDKRVKTEMLVQMQGVGNKNENVLILAATNLPYALDPAIRRRFDKRIHIPLPDHAARKQMFTLQLDQTEHYLTEHDFDELAWRTQGFSGSDIAVCVKSVLFEPIRKVQAAWFFKKVYSNSPLTRGDQLWTPCGQYEAGAYATTLKDLEAKGWGGKIQLPPIAKADFDATLAKCTPTVSPHDLELHLNFTREFGEEG